MNVLVDTFKDFGAIFENFPELRREHTFLRFYIIGKARTFKKFLMKQFFRFFKYRIIFVKIFSFKNFGMRDDMIVGKNHVRNTRIHTSFLKHFENQKNPNKQVKEK